MRLARELLSAFVLMIIAFLVLDKATGFSKDIAALRDFTVGSAKVFQGR
jgi:hypothetical protein